MKARNRKRPKPAKPAAELAELRERLAEAQATLHAIRKGEVDAIVVDSRSGPRVFTLDGAEFDYRILIESMNEGALVLTREALILYANARFGGMVERPLSQLMGCSLFDLLSGPDRAALRRLLKHPRRALGTVELELRRPYGAALPVRVSIQRLPGDTTSIGMVVSDMSEFRRREELLRHFSRRLMRLQEQERRQIASDLGDHLSQLLCAALARCESLAERLPAKEHGFRDQAAEFAALLRTTAAEVHRISSELRPHGLEVLGLEPALRGMAAEFAERLCLPVEVRCAKLDARLPAEAELVLFRVLQEALRNVEQHAHARHVEVSLLRRGPAVRLAVKDDGVGFDVAGARVGHFGLLGMFERAATAGGSLRLNSTRSTGTEVVLTVPLPPARPPAA